VIFFDFEIIPKSQFEGSIFDFFGHGISKELKYAEEVLFWSFEPILE
jgi:hypothetical protein